MTARAPRPGRGCPLAPPPAWHLVPLPLIGLRMSVPREEPRPATGVGAQPEAFENQQGRAEEGEEGSDLGWARPPCEGHVPGDVHSQPQDSPQGPEADAIAPVLHLNGLPNW